MERRSQIATIFSNEGNMRPKPKLASPIDEGIVNLSFLGRPRPHGPHETMGIFQIIYLTSTIAVMEVD